MLLFPNCKINLGLNIVGRRSDGYHELETIFYPIYKLYDGLEILPQVSNDPQIVDDVSAISKDFKTVITDKTVFNQIQNFPNVSFQASGLLIKGNAENNLCVKAYDLLKKDFPELPPVNLCLHKAIPMGAGLGGGSADGAFTLQLLNQQFQLKLLTAQLIEYALQLGSDCPFFILNKPAFAQGRGEILEPISLDLTGFSMVIIHPGIHVSTAQAFARVQPKHPVVGLQELITEPIETWKQNVVNDFEETVFQQYPILDEIKNKLYETGATYAAMSGSGSAIYGIYKTSQLPSKKIYTQYFEVHIDL